MRILNLCVLAILLVACKSDAEKACFDGAMDQPGRVSACGEVCDQGNQEGCATQSKVGLQRCFTDHHAETCRWMCLYTKTGKDLYCAEHEKITGKPVE